LNVILGAGVLGLPFALRESGLLIGILLLAIVALGAWSEWLFARRCAKLNFNADCYSFLFF
jgi:amino acid permease